MKMKCVLILLGILGVALLGIVMDIGYTPPDKGEVFVPQVSSTWTEINPARTDEDRRDHFRDETGRHRVEIYYKNGNRGTVITRADRTAESERYTRADGSLIKEVFFSADGKNVVSGEERREDGSTIWKTGAEKNELVTTVFWRDGKTVFARTALDLSADRRSVTQFDRQGSKRFLTESVASTRLIDRQVEYGDNEVPLRERVNLGKDPKTSGIDVVHYRADGTIEARQKFRNVQSCYEACSEYFVNRHVFLMDAEGAHVQKDVEISDSLLPKTVVEFLGDGAQLIYELKLDTEKPYEAQRVYRTEFMDPNGELILIKESQTDGELFVLPKRFLEPLTFEIGLLKSWKELEQDVAANK